MHGLLPLVLRSFSLLLGLCLTAGSIAAAQDPSTDDTSNDTPPADVESPFSVRIDPRRISTVTAQVTVSGSLITPSADGQRTWDLSSQADFQWQQRQLSSELTGPLGLQAIRRYTQAAATTSVGADHTTKSALPGRGTVIHIQGSDTGLTMCSETGLLTRARLDLLQMPCDPLPCSGLLPARDIKRGEKWNTEQWVLPQIAGLDAVVKQSLTCELMKKEASEILVKFTGTANGAVLGSAASVELNGTLVMDMTHRMITQCRCELKEKRSPGPVSPGLDALVNVQWTQTLSPDASLPEQLNTAGFEHPLQLNTPWQLLLHHSPEWHVFNQTDRVLMLRQIRNGALISQCNLSPGVAMPAGQHTADVEFRSDVERSIQSVAGRIVEETTLPARKGWRTRRIQTVHQVKETSLVQDYYLCSAPSGAQFSLMFSYSQADAEAFGPEASRVIGSLTIPRKRTALPFR